MPDSSLLVSRKNPALSLQKQLLEVPLSLCVQIIDGKISDNQDSVYFFRSVENVPLKSVQEPFFYYRKQRLTNSAALPIILLLKQLLSFLHISTEAGKNSLEVR